MWIDPRARGGETLAREERQSTAIGRDPRARGGDSAETSFCLTPRWVDPRARGDSPIGIGAVFNEGRSPRTRGRRALAVAGSAADRSIPARGETATWRLAWPR